MKPLRVLQDLALVPTGKSCALIIRHADRDGQVDRLLPKDEGLNDTGRRRATELGKALRRFDLLRLLSSPIGRCVETCEHISEGYGEKVEVEPTEFLGMRCPTMLKPDEAYRLMGSMGLYSFTEAYVAGRLDPKVVRSCEDGAKMLFSYAIDSFREKDNQASVIVTHDMLVTPAMVKYFGFDVRRTGLVPFLDGMVLYSSDYGYRLAYDHRVLKLSKEGEPRA
jgi:hypothetical protein